MKASDLPGLLPEKINDWIKSDTDRFYNNETLYNYIDGAAELYISYGFDTVISRRYSCPNEPDIVVEIFNMLEPRNAFGVFTNMREKNDHAFGQGSQQLNSSLIFWKNKYFVSIITERYSEKSKTASTEIAKYIEKLIPLNGNTPEIVKYLPGSNLVPEGYCYFHHYIWINSFYFISNNNLFHIDNNVNAVLAKYGDPSERMYLLLIEYPDNQKANDAYQHYISEYAPELKTKEFVKVEDKTWVTAKISKNYISVVFNIKNKKDAEILLTDLFRNLESSDIINTKSKLP